MHNETTTAEIHFLLFIDIQSEKKKRHSNK